VTTAPADKAARPTRASAGGYLLPVCLGAAMVACAQLTGERAVLFPGGVALCFGVWVVGRPDWCHSRLRLAVAPVLCAVCGVLLTQFVATKLIAELAGLSCAAVILMALPSRVAPSLSAAVLPTVFDVRSWIYPVAVSGVMAVIVLGTFAFGGRGAVERSYTDSTRWPLRPVMAYWLIGALWLIAVAVMGLPLVASAPPLLVSGLEWLVGGPVGLRVGVNRGLLLTVAWMIGSVAVWQFSSPVLAGSVAVLVGAVLMWNLKVPHAPVLAMALAAEVTGAPNSWADLLGGGLSVALAVTVLYLLGSCAHGFMAGSFPFSSRTVRARTSMAATGLRHVAVADPQRSRP
jgi:hypothetical protein